MRSHLADFRAAQEARAARLAAAREKERKERSTSGATAFQSGERKRPKLGVAKVVAGGGEAGDEEFLPEDKENQTGGLDGVQLSSEVRQLMAK